MFPTEQYQVATLMRKDFSKEVAHKLVQAFKQADGIQASPAPDTTIYSFLTRRG